MKTIKALSLIIGIVLCFIFVTNVLGYRSNVANGITVTKIKKIEIGMTLDQVTSILGKPFKIENLEGQHDFSCKKPNFLETSINVNTDIAYIVYSFFNDTSCCETYKKDRQKFGKRVTLTYTKPVRFSKYYPILWVHLDCNYQVNGVYAKRYDFIDDVVIYSLFRNTDTTTLEEIPNEISLFINNALFNECFK